MVVGILLSQVTLANSVSTVQATTWTACITWAFIFALSKDPVTFCFTCNISSLLWCPRFNSHFSLIPKSTLYCLKFPNHIRKDSAQHHCCISTHSLLEVATQGILGPSSDLRQVRKVKFSFSLQLLIQWVYKHHLVLSHSLLIEVFAKPDKVRTHTRTHIKSLEMNE